MGAWGGRVQVRKSGVPWRIRVCTPGKSNLGRSNLTPVDREETAQDS